MSGRDKAMRPEIDGDADKAARLAALDAFKRRRDAAHTQERHGAGRILGIGGRPQRAEGCLLPDGVVTDAIVVALPEEVRHGMFGWGGGSVDGPDGQSGDADAPGRPRRIDPEACVWLRLLVPGGAMARRGRVVIEPGVALRFLDEPKAGEGEAAGGDRRAALPPSLERDLGLSPSVARRTSSDLFARLLYAALCNTGWRHRATGTPWSCSWRGAGDVVAHLRGEGDYMDWYCSGGEGLVDEGVLKEIDALGWDLVPENGDPTGDSNGLSEAGALGDGP